MNAIRSPRKTTNRRPQGAYHWVMSKASTRREDPHPLLLKVADNIDRLCTERGWSQRRLAIEAGIGTSGLNALTKGLSAPKPDTLVKISEALGVSVSDLFRDDDPEACEVIDKCLRALRACPPEQRRVFRASVEAYLEALKVQLEISEDDPASAARSA